MRGRVPWEGKSSQTPALKTKTVVMSWRMYLLLNVVSVCLSNCSHCLMCGLRVLGLLHADETQETKLWRQVKENDLCVCVETVVSVYIF